MGLWPWLLLAARRALKASAIAEERKLKSGKVGGNGFDPSSSLLRPSQLAKTRASSESGPRRRCKELILPEQARQQKELPASDTKTPANAETGAFTSVLNAGFSQGMLVKPTDQIQKRGMLSLADGAVKLVQDQ